jgi:Polysaccharide lyase
MPGNKRIAALRVLACWVLVFSGLAGAKAADLDEEFKEGLDQTRWCACQLDPAQLPHITRADPNEHQDMIAAVSVDKLSMGDRGCDKACFGPAIASFAPEMTESLLGPSLVMSDEVDWKVEEKAPNPYCTPEALKKAGKTAKECIQREELRLSNAFTGDPRKARQYALRFRMPDAVLNQTHSIRWIMAQWKMEPVKMNPGDEDPSPFLAQRYDNGVFHITVQNAGCRCLVASAPLPNGKNYSWKDEEARYCVWTDGGAHDGQTCPSGLTLKYGDQPRLDSPSGQWVEMEYRVQTGDDATIEVHQNGRFIVSVKGHIGYPLDLAAGKPKPKTKFKMGHYRDYIPSTDEFEVDWMRITDVK